MKAFLVLTFCLTFFQQFYKIQAAPESQLTLSNVSYGTDQRQIMDIYLPEGRNQTISKVLLLIHGGGWVSGSKENFNYILPFLRASFPMHAIANMNYRFGSIQSPALPKQIEDVNLAIQHLISKKVEYKINPEFGLIGASAGAHLALLYGFGFNYMNVVKVICNQVGPTNLLDPYYTNNTAYKYAFVNLVGNYTYQQNPGIYIRASPVYYATKNSPKTISFYGGRDTLVPKSQGETLEDKLDSLGVCNKYYVFPEAGHGNWSPTDINFIAKKLIYFFKNYL